jgi:DNA mismatch endonuclease (patch repair protein)
VIFVHGCFWHQHPGCREGRMPGSRREYWEPKLRRNQERDAASHVSLTALGWRCLTVWECQLKDAVAVRKTVKRFLGTAAG